MSKLFDKISIESINDELIENINEDDLDDYITSNFNESIESIDSMERTIVALESVLDICSHVQNKSSISVEEHAIINIALENMVANTPYQPKHLIPGLEEWKENISIEEVTDAVERNINSVSSLFSKILVNLTANIKAIGAFINLHKSKTKKLKEQISKSDIKDATIELKDSKYWRYGDNNSQIQTGAEYSDVFKTDMGKVSDVLDIVSKFQKDSLFISWKTLFKVLSDKKIKENFDILYNLITKTKDALDMKKVKSYSNFVDVDEYSSGHLLGMSAFLVYLPSKKEFNKESIQSVKNTLDYFDLIKTNDNIFASSITGGKFEVTGIDNKQLTIIADSSLEVIDAYKQLMKFSNKFSNFGSGIFVNDFLIGTSVNLPLLRLFLSNYRLVLKMASIDVFVSNELYFYAKGNVKHANRFIENALKNNR